MTKRTGWVSPHSGGETSSGRRPYGDRDGVYGADFRRRVQSMGIEEVIIAARSPWQSPYVERMIGSVRRECLDNVVVLITVEDTWKTFACDPDPAGCSVTFSDPEFADSGRDALYYVRAIESPIMAVNADLLRCEKDDRGRCLAVDACTADRPVTDDCLAVTEQRAWSSPIFLTSAGGRS